MYSNKRILYIGGLQVRGFNFKSIGTKITIAVALLVIIICTSLGFLSYNISAKILTTNISTSLENRVKDNARLVENFLRTYMSEIEGITYHHEVYSMDWHLQKPELSSEKQRLGLHKIGIADLDGNMRYHDDNTQNIKNHRAFELALEGGKTIQDISIDGQDVLLFSLPVLDDGDNMVGVVWAFLDIKHIENLIMDILVSESSYAFILNKDASVVAHVNYEKASKTNDATTSATPTDAITSATENGKENPENNASDFDILFEQMRESQSGSGEYEMDGHKKLIAFAPIKDTNWSLALAEYKDNVFYELQGMQRSIILITSAFIFLGIVFSIFLAKKIKNPIVEMKEFSQKLSNYDLSGFVPSKGSDEFTQMASSMNIAVANIKELIRKIIDITGNTEEASNAILSSSQEVAAASEEISHIIDEMSTGSNHQAKEAEEVSSMVYLLSQVMAKTSDISLQAEASTGIMQKANKSGLNAINELKESIIENNKAIANVIRAVEDILEHSASIDIMVETISEIADHTNLLALNASIEAARAGDEGRGFAVVAEEIRKLADESASSTEEIRKITEKITAVIKTASAALQGSEKTIEQINSSMAIAEKAFQKTNTAIDDTVAEIEKLNQSIVEMEKGREKVVPAIENITAITEESAAGSLQIRASVEEQTASIHEVSEKMQELTHIIKSLSESIKKFKI